MSAKGLNERQRRFVQEYLIDLNATQAAIRAGYSEKTANRTGPENLSKPVIAEAISEATTRHAQKVEASAERVLADLNNIAHADLPSVADLGICGPEDLGKLPQHLRPAVAGWNWDKDGRFCIKWVDKLRAMEMLTKHLGLNAPEKVDLNVTGELSVKGDGELMDELRTLTAALGLPQPTTGNG